MRYGVLHRYVFAALVAVLVIVGGRADASPHSGKVTFNGLPVPGARVVASTADGDVTSTTVTDEDGAYRFDNLNDGAWVIGVELSGFAAAKVETTVVAGAEPLTIPLTLLPFEQIATTAPAATPPVSQVPAITTSASRRDEPGADVRRADDALPAASADSFLLNGSVNNSAASAFAQMAAFGNNRRNGRSLYNGGLQVRFGSSALDARPFSFDRSESVKPDYSNAQILGTFAGPLRLGKMLRNGPQLFVGVQHALDHSATSQSARVPTALERAGDFSQSVNAVGQPVVPIDPQTGQPFPNRRIPAERIAPQASALLGLYPQASPGGDEYQTSTLGTSRQSSVQLRASQQLTRRDALFGNLLYARTAADNTGFFGFTDQSLEATTTNAVNWSRRQSQFTSFRMGYEGSLQTNRSTPYFSNRANISGDAGIGGNDQTPENWGPPSLTFASGLATLQTPAFSDNHGRTDSVVGELYRNFGRHNLTIGGGAGRQSLNIFSQQDARGAFSFTGATTGSDIGDFLLGRPATASIAYGNADKVLSGATANLYLNDDWRASSSLTLNVGIRWEYESPLVEARNRLSNIDVASDFSASAQVTAGTARGPISGTEFGASLLRADWRNIQPRVGVAWRPVAGSSLVVRGGYGAYRNGGVYQAVSLLLSQQAPFSTAAFLTSNATNPLAMASAFVNAQASTANTFGVDPDLRIGVAHNWQVSAQRDLPGSLTVLGSYNGTAGRHLLQEFLPNTWAPGAQNGCPTCPSGFVYLTSNGDSLRNAAQVQLRRRLRNGLTATAQYTLAKATDNASAFVPVGNPLANGASTTGSGASSGIAGATIAQDWRDLAAEQSRSPFDRRHQLSLQVQFTSGMGVTGGALRSGPAAALLNGWTFAADVTANSGAPLTPVIIAPVGGAGIVGSLRPTLTGASQNAADGLYLNADAYAPPAAGQWGNAGRDSVSGPSEFTVNGGISRSFQWGERATAEWRIDSTNLFNQVNYTAVNTALGNPLFGEATRAAAMRKIQASLRVRF